TSYSTTSTEDPDLALIDGMIERLEQSPELARSLFLEHLQCARVYLQGAMPAEYSHNLELAKNAVKLLNSKDLRKELLWTVATLQADLAQHLNSHPSSVKEPAFHAPSTSEADLEHFFK